MSPGPRSTSLPSGILIHPAVLLQQTWAENWRAVPLWGGAGSPFNTMWPGPRPTSIVYLHTKWHLDPSSRLATIHGPRSGRLLCPQVNDVVLSQEDQPQTHSTVREISRKTGIPKSSVVRIIRKDLQLRCFKRRRAQELTEANCTARKLLLKKFFSSLPRTLSSLQMKWCSLWFQQWKNCNTVASVLRHLVSGILASRLTVVCFKVSLS